MLADNARLPNDPSSMNTQHLPTPACGWLADPRAFAARPIDLGQVPVRLQAWVAVAGSLTSALATAFGATPTVRVHYSGPSQLSEWETQWLQLSVCAGFARQIQLDIDDKPVVAARTVLARGGSAEATLEGLHTKPLAKLLFESQDWQPSGEQRALATSDGLIGRGRAWRHLPSDEAIVVEEFFLPALTAAR